MYVEKIINFFLDKRIQIILGLFLVIFSLTAYTVKGETLTYDNISVSQYKFITLSELNIIPLIPDYKYKVLINNSFFGYFGKDDNIFYPDNSNITIIIPSPILTDTNNIWILSIKPMLFNMIGFMLTWGLLLIIILYVIYRIQRKIRKGY